MSNDRTDPRWEEYLSTGVDPCDDGKNGCQMHKPRKSSERKNDLRPNAIASSFCVFLFACFCIYGLFFTPADIQRRSKKKEAERQDAIEREEMIARMKAIIEYSSSSDQKVEYDTTTARLPKEVQQREEEEYWYRRTGSVSQRTNSSSQVTIKKDTPYQQGYHDGYDEGYDDRILKMGFGYKYDCDGESDEYRQGYDKGYSDGYTDGYEDYEAFGDDEL